MSLASGLQTAWSVPLLNTPTGVTFGSAALNSIGYSIASVDSSSGLILLSNADYTTFSNIISTAPDINCLKTLGGFLPNCYSSTTQCSYYIS